MPARAARQRRRGRDPGRRAVWRRARGARVKAAAGSSDELAAIWDARYGVSERLWSGRVNPVLEAEAVRLTAGRALDAGCGEGGDSLWLARRGWRVTGYDLSAVAIERSRAEAARLGVSDLASFDRSDLAVDPPSESAFDLVSGQYLHVIPSQREPLYRGLAAAVRPGGMLLLVLHDIRDLELGIARPPGDTMLGAEELRAFADGFTSVHLELRPRAAVDRAEAPATAHDLVLRVNL
ncbi:bifunctional 2-polyprenyl-6-hydroxyphenol methylase/3-demethylubiquinol 3-O-methyltransferase UbiG [Microcella alkalica]|uniref:class I SAM-dependent methyltransferase n=1 Tax=Microcella alkalica TaxID=355930 RepID=UPI0016612142|nr:class I SAM-dependent methyltransferase [Microcella alkalica]